MNGTLGTIQAIDRHGQFKVALDRDDLKSEPRLVKVDPQEYNHLEHGYAATVYKAQGVTVDRTYLLASPHYDAHSSYVGLTRHRLSCDVFFGRDVFKDQQALIQTLGRQRHKDVSLDYSQDNNHALKQFGQGRGIDFNLATPELKQAYLKQEIERRRPELEARGQQLLETLKQKKHQRDEQEIKAPVKTFHEQSLKRNPAYAAFLKPNPVKGLVKDVQEIVPLPSQTEKQPQKQKEKDRLTKDELEHDYGRGRGR